MADTINQSDLTGSEINLMNPDLWTPAGDEISLSYPGIDASWLNQTPIWTLPGMEVKRESVSIDGRPQLNHMQFSVKTRHAFKSFRLSLEFRFENEDVRLLHPTWIGNSGVYIFGLYEIQIMKTGFYSPQAVLDPQFVRDGIVRATTLSQTIQSPVNQFLCGSIYGGGTSGQPNLGAPTNAEGKFVNICADVANWHQMDIEFMPAKFEGAKKTADATVSVKLNGRAMLYGGKDRYSLPGPTGSQIGRLEKAQGPIVIQDHGSRVSFRKIKIIAL